VPRPDPTQLIVTLPAGEPICTVPLSVAVVAPSHGRLPLLSVILNEWAELAASWLLLLVQVSPGTVWLLTVMVHVPNVVIVMVHDTLLTSTEVELCAVAIHGVLHDTDALLNGMLELQPLNAGAAALPLASVVCASAALPLTGASACAVIPVQLTVLFLLSLKVSDDVMSETGSTVLCGCQVTPAAPAFMLTVETPANIAARITKPLNFRLMFISLPPNRILSSRDPSPAWMPLV
jgi:hypothetical protein